MSVKSELLAEIKQEATNTRKILAKVPFENPDWKPHGKSMTIAKLATHIAENLRWGMVYFRKRFC